MSSPAQVAITLPMFAGVLLRIGFRDIAPMRSDVFMYELWACSSGGAPRDFNGAIGDCRDVAGRARTVTRLFEETGGDDYGTERVLSAVRQNMARCAQRNFNALSKQHGQSGARGAKRKTSPAAALTPKKHEAEAVCDDLATEVEQSLRDEASTTQFFYELDAAVGLATQGHVDTGWHRGTEPLLDFSPVLRTFAARCPQTAAAYRGLLLSPHDVERRSAHDPVLRAKMMRGLRDALASRRTADQKQLLNLGLVVAGAELAYGKSQHRHERGLPVHVCGCGVACAGGKGVWDGGRAA